VNRSALHLEVAVDRSGGIGWRIADAVFLLAFTASVIVQYNDPDPLLWMLMWGAAAAACALMLARRLHWALPAAVGLVALVWAATLAPGVIGQVPFTSMFGAFEMKSAGIEESREMYGLLLIAGYMAVLAVRARPSGRRA
jgi:hypothetical protein